MDFAENYACTTQDEVQSAHWKQAQIKLYASVAWFRSDIFLHIIIGDNLKHDKYAVVVYLSEILEYKPENVHFLKVLKTKNSQFKNKYVMGAIEMLSEMHNIKIIWNFSPTSHGKGPVDGVGATLKRMAADKVCRRESIINNLQDFCNAVMHSSVKVTCMSVDEFQVHVENLGLQKLFESVQPIPDMTEYHYIEFENKNVWKYYSSLQANQPTSTNDAAAIETNDSSKLSFGKIVSVHIKSEKTEGCNQYLHGRDYRYW